MEETAQPQSWQDLLRQLIEDPHQRQNLAHKVRVNPITLQRWASSEVKPREDNMRLLLEAFPQEYLQAFQRAIAADFPRLATQVQPRSILPQPPPEFYGRVLNAYANTPPSLYTQTMYDLILQQAIEHFDPDRRGMAITIVRCVPPLRGTKVQCLREIAGIGTPPWSRDLAQKTTFLGAESLAGTAVTHCRPIVVQNREEHFPSFAVQWSEHEQSALASPLMHQARVAGCLLIASARPHTFKRDHMPLAEAYAHLTSLALSPQDFFEIKDIDLRLMPSYKLQEEYFSNFRQRVRNKLLEAANKRQALTLPAAQELVWQEIAEELLALPFFSEIPPLR